MNERGSARILDTRRFLPDGKIATFRAAFWRRHGTDFGVIVDVRHHGWQVSKTGSVQAKVADAISVDPSVLMNLPEYRRCKI